MHPKKLVYCAFGKLAVPVLLLAGCSFAAAASVFTTRIDDPRAVYLTTQEFGAHGDGQADDSAAVQAAIDKADRNAGMGREGIVFVPAGRYRLTRTIYLWPGVRVFGYGPTRPVFVLADNTPGFQKGMGDMVMFTGARRGAPFVTGGTQVAFPPPCLLTTRSPMPMRTHSTRR
jgi:hypothetical protein